MTSCTTSVFHPAFDVPTTRDQALEVLSAWGNPSTMTFSADRAKRIHELLSAPAPIILSEELRNSLELVCILIDESDVWDTPRANAQADIRELLDATNVEK